MNCEEISPLLLEFAEGELSAEQNAAIRAHLRKCPACAARERETRKLLGDLGAARSMDNTTRLMETATTAAFPQSSGPAPRLFLHPRIIGDFEILAELGRGGMGIVYRARQITLNRVVALKVLNAAAGQSERMIARFRKEAQAAARLHHTHIVPIYAQGCEEGYLYYAMELIEGRSLDQVLQSNPSVMRLEEAVEPDGLPPHEAQSPHALPGRELSPSFPETAASHIARSSTSVRLERRAREYKRIARLIAEAAEGLQHAHEQGIIHRDIKPQNLLLGRDDKLHITDFGLARLLDEPGLTLSAEILGTPAYMSPEQIAGDRQSIDRRTDIYSLGVTLYELLTLTRPFRGDSYDQIIHQVLKREPTPPRKLDAHIPVDLETICLRAMDKDAQRRFATAADMARDLRRYAEDFPITSRRIGVLGKAARWTRRHPAQATAGAAILAVLILVPILWGTVNANANARITAAFDVLLEDYRDHERALAQLGWANRFGGNRHDCQIVEAFAAVRPQPQIAVQRLKSLLKEQPRDRDAHYLLAWALIRAEGDPAWAAAQKLINDADALAGEATAAGWFFRGQALLDVDPRAAAESYTQAISRRLNFNQALLHQVRALNQIMYLQRDIGYYQQALATLNIVTTVQPNKAYPRYLLSRTHTLAAEILMEQGKPEEARKAYANSLSAARDAQAKEPASPRGYAAEADGLESQGDFTGALAAWNRIQEPAVPTSSLDRWERDTYRMRLYFWLGDYANAEKMRVQAYSDAADFDPDAIFYKALFAQSAGNRGAALQALEAGLRTVPRNAEAQLLLDAAYRLLGEPPPPDLLSDKTDFEKQLPPRWTPEWLRTLVRYQRGEVRWENDEAIRTAARAQSPRAEDLQFLLAGAYFFHGVRELAAGRRPLALEAFAQAWRQHDKETYCFRAKLLLYQLQRNPAWLAELSNSRNATP